MDSDLGGNIRLARGKFSTTQVHALIAEQIFNGQIVKRPGWAGYLEAIGVMLFGSAAIMWSQKLDFWKTLGVASLVSFLILILSYTTFSMSHLLLNPLPIALSLFLGAFSVAGGRTLGVVLRDDVVRGSFQDSLPESAMKKIREERATHLLNGVHRPITVLACELRILDSDLRKLSAHPNHVTNMMAAACSAVRNTILATGGAVDQADGGKIYAYYNAPLEFEDHIEAACSSALRLVESMDKTNTELETSSHTRGVQLHLAVGIATGECVVGPMGHGRSNRFSAIGPAIEMATFLRKQAEIYGPAIICDEQIQKQTHHHFAFLEMDRLHTNKSNTPTRVYALVGNPFIKSSKGYRTLLDTHQHFLSAYRSGNWNEARKLLTEIKSTPGGAISLFDLYEKRIDARSKLAADPDWDGTESVSI